MTHYPIAANAIMPSHSVPRSNPRRKISTTVKFLASTNALPVEYAKKLHASQLSRYKSHFDIKEYVGHDLLNISDEVIAAIRKMNQHSTDRKIIYGYLRLSSVFRNAFAGHKHFYKTIAGHKDQLIEAIQRLQPAVPVEKCAKFIGVSISTVRSWITSIRTRCSGSLLNLCRKVHPNQLLPAETATLEELLKDEQFKYWPLVSIYYHALHHKLASMSLSSWYKYAALLNIRRLKSRGLKQYGESIRASTPNQYWHADVMQFRTQDGILNYIYLVADNFSKMILAWAVDTKLSGEIRAHTFRNALATALSYHPVIKEINLVVDGGSENNNATIEQFIASVPDPEIKKLRALREVSFSNSQAEAINRIIKTAYLNQMEIPNTATLHNTLAEIIHDLSFVRPHGSIDGLIPFDRYKGKGIDKQLIQQQISQARTERIERNSNLPCSRCLF